MRRISQTVNNIADNARYTVIVVGSGYGGGIAACRLARTGQSVCVLERGKEWLAGEFPDTIEAGIHEMQIDAPHVHEGPATGLYDFHINEEIDAVIGCGLGGTSLINANVALEPDPRVFDNPHWPPEVREHRDTLLKDGYRQAQAMLQSNPYPETAPELPKLSALQASAKTIDRPFARPPINVTFEDRINAAGVEQKACVYCGDCVSGCNYLAKNTVNLNYLADAHKHGAHIFTEVSVRYLQPDGDGWRVYYVPTGDGDADMRTLQADIVILAAGTLGSTEILLRSAQQGLSLSPNVGSRFSANGDFLGFAYNNNTEIRGVGYGNRDPKSRPPVGPTITGVIYYPPGQPLEDQFIIEEGAIPGLFGVALPAAFASAAAAIGHNTATSITEKLAQAARTVESLIRGPYKGADNNTQTYLAIGQDDAGGTMYLQNDRLRISWPDVGEQPIYKQMQPAIIAATSTYDGIYVKEPTWVKILHNNVITVHPLGGCFMGDSAANGVINHKNQVFSGPTGTDVYTGLYVTDGSAIPCAVGVNPLLTISAVAERAMALLIADRGWQGS